MFGTRWLAMLFGFAFFSHQVGGFLGVWLGGVVFERTGSYDAVWWLAIGLGVLSAVINLPIVEKPVRGPPPRRPELIVQHAWQIPRHCRTDRFEAAYLAHAGGDRRVRLSHRHDQLRAALGVRLVPDADVECERLGA